LAKVTPENVKAFYGTDVVVGHYARATANIGLWQSEEHLIRKLFKQDDRIIELGSGTGRISIGMAELGYQHVMGVEISRAMVKEARRIARLLELSVVFRTGDATELSYEDSLFDGAIFGFNGLMQIPGRETRRAAMVEIGRVVRPGGLFLFTTHDRNLSRYKKFWRQEQRRWDRGEQSPELLEFGDKYEDTDLGKVFIHVPVPEEIREDLMATGWKCEWDSLRSQVCQEALPVREFSDECRFWVARKL